MNSESLTQPQISIDNDSPMSYFQNIGNSSSNLFGQLFSSAFGMMKWFIGLRWYVIFLIVVFGSYLLFQMEYAIESRRRNKELKHEKTTEKEKTDENKENKKTSKKEGMEEYYVERMKGILRQSNQLHNNEKSKKHVSFYNEKNKNEKPIASVKNNVGSFMSQVYNWWIVPWVYVLFRNIGVNV